MANESKTPRTEKEIIKTLGLSVQHALSSMKDFARQLETELANSEKKVFAYKTALEQSESELIDARAEVERDELKKQLAEARAALDALSVEVGQAIVLRSVDFSAGEDVEPRSHAIWAAMRETINERDEARAEIERLKRCCNCEYANHKLEICENPDNEPETFMDGVCDHWSHNI